MEGTRQIACWIALASLGGCQCGFDAGKLDRLACTTDADCALDQDCVSGSCTQRGCLAARDCGDPDDFACIDGFCEVLGDGDADGDADTDADADGDGDTDGGGPGPDAGRDAGADAAADGGADAGSPPGDCTGQEGALAGLYDHDGDPATADVDLLDIGSSCALSCVQAGPGCPAECIVAATGGAVSEPCAACLETAGQCAIASCLGDCLADAHAPECITCSCDNCDETFRSCAGVGSPWCGN